MCRCDRGVRRGRLRARIETRDQKDRRDEDTGKHGANDTCALRDKTRDNQKKERRTANRRRSIRSSAIPVFEERTLRSACATKTTAILFAACRPPAVESAF